MCDIGYNNKESQLVLFFDLFKMIKHMVINKGFKCRVLYYLFMGNKFDVFKFELIPIRIGGIYVFMIRAGIEVY